MHNNNIVLTILFTALLGLSKADFTEDLLKHHNELRAIHNSQPLALSTDLSKKAETIAREAALNGKFFKNKTGTEEPGVNTELICSSFKRTIEDAKQVTEAWYGEVCNKDFSFERPFTAPTFARMIRKDAKFLGVGKASNEDDKQPCTYIVAVYDPIGKKDTSSNILEKGNFQYSSFCKNNRKKRSLYYRFPARFVIDPVTGQTKSVTPLKPTNTHQWHTVATGDFSENAPFGLPSESRSNTAEEGTPQYSYVSQRNLVRHKHLHSHLHKMTSKGHRKSHVIKTNEDEANNEEEEGDKRDAAPVATASVTAEALEAHNILRRIHGSPAMALNDEMAQDAQKVAESNAATGELKHSSSKELKDYGENLAFNCDPTGQFASIRESVKDWYMEACPDKGQPAYDFENQPGPGLVSHFTQLVWGDSIELGCGSATGEIEGLKCIFFACRYKKKGNMDGQYDDNVKKGDFEVSETCPNIKGILHIGERATTGPENVPGTGLATGPSIGEVTGPGEIVLPVPTDGSSEIFRDEVTYQTDCLKVINRFRQIHLSPVLVADVLLHDEALKIAEALVDTEDTRNKMKEKLKSNKQGLFQISCSPDNKVLPPEESMANWYREVCFRLKDFDFTSKDNLKKAPHFTQLVWRSSKKVGIAYATKTKPKSKTLCTVVVAKFDPIGNGDDLVENVAQGSFDRSFCGSIHSMALNALVTPAVVKPEKLITPSGSVITDIIECNRKPTILPDGTKVTPEGEMFTASNAKITPCGGKVRPGGSEIKPDGNVVTVGGETVKPDGNIVTSSGKEVKPGELPTKPDGSRVTPGGSEVKPDGNVVTPEGETIKPGGVVVKPSGEVVKPVSETVKPEAETVKPDGSRVTSGGSEIKPDGNVITPEGETVKPDGTIVTSDGKETKPEELPTNPDGSRITPGGSEVKPNGEVVTPEGETIKPGGEVVKPDGSVVTVEGETVKKPEVETVKPDGSRVTSGESEIKPDGNVVTPEGETIKPDGNIVTSGGKEIKPEELPIKPDGSRVTPGGSEVKPDGNVVTPEGETIKPGGEVVKPSGEVVKPETVQPTGEAVKPDGSRVTSGGSEIKTDGSVVTPEGETIKPDGTAVKPSGEVVKPEEQEVKPDGSRVTPNGAEVKPDGSVVTSGGETVKPENEKVETGKPAAATGESEKPPEGGGVALNSK